jgi:hypothetical protein
MEKNDGSTIVESFWDSIDFTLPQVYKSQEARWFELEFEAKGSGVDVYYSIDSGNTYSLLKSVTLGEDEDTYRIFIDKTAPQFRVRFKNDASNGWVEIHWYRVWYLESKPGELNT